MRDADMIISSQPARRRIGISRSDIVNKSLVLQGIGLSVKSMEKTFGREEQHL
jgi:hypothetical protein